MDAPHLISRRQALASGMSDRELQRRCESGQWRRIRPGRYLDAPEPDPTPEGRHILLAVATCDAMSVEPVLSHCSALVFHGIPTWTIPLDRVHLTQGRINGGRIQKQLVVHAAHLEPDEITIVNDLRVTTPPRTVLDIARSMDFEQAVVIGDNALRMGLTTTNELRAHLERARQRRGARKAAHAIAFLDGRSESIGESLSRIAIQRGGLPAPELQARVFTDEEACVGRVDFLFAELGVIGEFDEAVEYRSELRGAHLPEQVVIAEKNREDQLRSLGWMVVRWTWTDLNDPTRLARKVHAAAAIAARTRRSGSWIPSPKP
ncbi:type IV toxin-antitoxin system AbiEi family antitoxin domain-containing protein [Nocardia sp. NPDC049149]|uniref:type IV toxin-antitoxin system AbiEi family antitoxin domain-containing protein n=1 Tax=Nocardia sp. NPDC049149 TaxID=3364315 RepID=UPI00371B0B97